MTFAEHFIHDQVQSGVAVIWYRLGTTLLRSGDIDKAQSALAEALKLDASSAAILVANADLQNEVSKPAEAMKLLLGAAELEPQAGQIAYRIAATYRRLGKQDEQLLWLRKRNDVAPTVSDPLLLDVARYSMNANFFALAGQRAWQRTEYENAIEAYRTALQLAPNQGTFKLDIANMLLKVGKVTESSNLVQAVIESSGESGRTWYLEAEVQRLHHKFTDSLRAANRSIELSDGNEARTLKAALLMRLHEFERAAEEYALLSERSEATEQEFYYEFWYGMAIYRMGQCAAAREIVSQVAGEVSSWGEAQVVLARLESECGDKLKGLELARNFVTGNNNDMTRATLIFAQLSLERTNGLLDKLEIEQSSLDIDVLKEAVRQFRMPDLIFPDQSNWWIPPEARVSSIIVQ